MKYPIDPSTLPPLTELEQKVLEVAKKNENDEDNAVRVILGLSEEETDRILTKLEDTGWLYTY